MFEVRKSTRFAAAHFALHPKAGHCCNVHGHTYQIEVSIRIDDDRRDPDTGFSVPYNVVSAYLKCVHQKYDHTCLNDHPEFSKDSSTEAVAVHVARGMRAHLDDAGFKHARIHCVEVSESNDAATRYYPDA